MLVSTDGGRACRCGAIGSTMGAYPRDTGSNPVEGKGHFFPSYRQLYLSSFSLSLSLSLSLSHTHTHTHTQTHTLSHMHDCFTIELTGECLKCLFRLTGGVPAVVVQSEALWARIPEIQVRIPSRAMGTFFPLTVSSIFRLSLTRLIRLSGGPCRCLASRSRR